MKKKLAEVLAELLSQGKSQAEIVAYFADEANTKDIEDIATADFSVSMTKAFELDDRKKALAGAFNAQAGAAQKSAEDKRIADLVAKQVKEALAATPAPSIFMPNGKQIQVVKDNSWREPMLKMVLAGARGDQATARELEAGIKRYNETHHGISYGSKATLRGDSDSVGGYVVTQDWEAGMRELMTDNFGVVAELDEIAIGSDTYNVQSVNTPTLTWTTNQDTALTETNQTFNTAALVLRDLGGFTNIANDLIADTNFNLLDRLQMSVAEAYGRELSAGVLAYDTAVTGNPFNGIYFTTSVGSKTSASGTLTIEDLTGLIAARNNRSLLGAKFFMNMRTLLEIESLRDNVGQMIVRTDLASGVNRFIKGFPVVITEDLPNTFNSALTARTGGTFSTILFGNIPKHFVFVSKAGSFEIGFSDQFRYTTRQTTMRFCKRAAWGIPSDVAPAFARLTSFTLTI